MPVVSEEPCVSISDRPQSPAALNDACFCITLEREALLQAIERDIGDPETSRLVTESRPHLFSNVSVFLSNADMARMSDAVATIERIAQLPAYQQAARLWAMTSMSLRTDQS